MAASNLKKLYGENASAGFSGNVLNEGHVNNIVSALLMADSYSLGFSSDGNTLDFGNGTTAILSRDATSNQITKITLKIRQLTDKTPLFPNTEKTIYKNNNIVEIDLAASSHVLLRADGTSIPSSYYSINTKGEIVWGAPQTASFLMIENLTFIDTQEITITRNNRGRIESINSKDLKLI